MPVIRTLSGVEKNVLITGTFSMGKDRNESTYNGSYNRHVLITGLLITGIYSCLESHRLIGLIGDN